MCARPVRCRYGHHVVRAASRTTLPIDYRDTVRDVGDYEMTEFAMRNLMKAAAAAALLTLAAGSISGPAVANPDDVQASTSLEAFVVEGQGVPAEPSADLLADLALASGGEAVADGDPRLWQDEFARAVAEIQRDYPRDYSGSAIEEDGVWVSFSNDAPTGAIEILQILPGPVEVRTGAGWNEVDIVALGEELHHSVLGRTGVADATTSIDTNSGDISVVAQLAQPGTNAEKSRISASVESRAQSIEEQAASDLSSIDVTVEFTVASVSSNDAINGGAVMSSSTGVCTSGFSVRSSSYANGMLTADHCANALSMSGTTLSYRGGSTSRDVQWHSSSAVANAQFHVGSSTLRAITSSQNPVSGTTVCKYGRTTGGSCDRVSLTSQCRGSYCGLYSVFERQAAPGDSGGPWYYGNTGYGIHSGRATISGADRDVFTGLQNAAGTLGVVVKLS